MDRNDLECDCNILWLWKHAVQIESAKNHRKFELFAKCSSPYYHKGKNLITLSKNDFECNRPGKIL